MNEFNAQRAVQINWKRARDRSASPRVRSGGLHNLMDLAQRADDHDLWLRIGRALIRACDDDDLTPQVSDHFVDACPDQIFKQVANASPRKRFKAWHRRANHLGVAKT